MDCVVVVADIHSGSTVAPWPAGTSGPDGTGYIPNAYQVWLNKCWADMLERVADLNTRRGGPVPVVVNGDVIQGVRPGQGQIMTNRRDVQTQAASRLLEPLRELASDFYITRGSEYHDGKCADEVNRLAVELGANPHSVTGEPTWSELYLDLSGQVIHFSHGISATMVSWYEGTAPLRDMLMLRSEISREYGGIALDVKMLVRSHRHRFIHIHATPDLHAVVTPGWQLRTAYTYRRGSVTLPVVGWVLIEAQDDDLVVKLTRYPLPLPKLEVVR